MNDLHHAFTIIANKRDRAVCRTTPLGVDVSTSWIRLLQEHSGIVALKTSNVSSKVAAIVPSGPGYDNKTSSLTKSVSCFLILCSYLETRCLTISTRHIIS